MFRDGWVISGVVLLLITGLGLIMVPNVTWLITFGVAILTNALLFVSYYND